VSYHLVIEGKEGARMVRKGFLPRRGDWLSLELEDAHWWLPVMEVGHALTRAEPPRKTESGADVAHQQADTIVITSLALGVKSPLERADEYRFVLPPSRWPFGGRLGDEEETQRDPVPPGTNSRSKS
jgi:hypothetical protein